MQSDKIPGSSYGRERYMGFCLCCLNETCVPMYRHTIETGASPIVHGIVWTCWVCGSDMFWEVTKYIFNENREYEWVHWSVGFFDRKQSARHENSGHQIPRHKGIWFQPVKTRTEGWSRFGQAWSGLKVDWDDGCLPFSGDYKTLPVIGHANFLEH